MAAGFNEFLTKPIDFEKLHSVLDGLLKSHSDGIDSKQSQPAISPAIS